MNHKSIINKMKRCNREVVTVIGSTKYRKEIKEWAWEQTKKGRLILFAPFAKEEIPGLENFRDELEIQHLSKIKLADTVFVFNKDNYIGDSTRLELSYAEFLNKKIEFLGNPIKSYEGW